ncbi:hypothetical protein [Halorubrum sp. CSM-61]|uniref:hypothetical protein n=1 Tax=Halorubrum sp. CSM-61 TaxID=2485838 RepID=UPI000F4C4FDD|nr:hypothetical protein [Halorubrum sp. CSM-61]
MSEDRKQLTSTQQAILYKKDENPNWSNAEIADAVGCSDSHVSKTLRKWDPDDMDDDGTVSVPSSEYPDAIPAEEVDSGMYPAAIVGVSIAWIAGFAGIFAQASFITVIGSLVAFGTWIGLPIVIALDTISLHKQNAPFRPNRIVWPAVSLVFGVVGGFAYLVARVSNL